MCGGEGVCPPCPSTLLLHFFNQRQKKAVFWPVCQQRPAATPLQQQPTLPPAAMQPPDKKTKIPANQEERRRSLTLTPSCLQHSPASFLLFFPAYCSFPQLIFFFVLKSLQETANLIKFTLLIFVCISCFVLLDVLIRPFWVEVLFCKTVSFAKKEMNLNVAVTFLVRLETGYPPRK